MNAILARTPAEIARWILYVGLVLAGLACLIASAFMGRDDLWGVGLLLIGYAVPAFNVNKTKTKAKTSDDTA